MTPPNGGESQWRSVEVGLIWRPCAKARVQALAVVERDSRTPTGSFSERLFIPGIHGSGYGLRWFGIRVAIHEVVDKVDGAVFRGTLGDSRSDRGLEVPAWMFDRSFCPHGAYLTESMSYILCNTNRPNH